VGVSYRAVPRDRPPLAGRMTILAIDMSQMTSIFRRGRWTERAQVGSRAARTTILVLALFVSGCRGLDDPGASVGVFFPRHGLSGPHLLAPLKGLLEINNGCLWVVEPGGTKRMPIWPPRFGLRRPVAALQVVDSAGLVVAAEGEMVTLVGGEYPTDAARALMGRDEPSACRGYGFWVVGAVGQSRPGGSSIP
jgi:hypothetical protein